MFSLIHLAGRQLLPNLLASMALHRRNALRRMVVIHTADAAESERPAAALFEMLKLLPRTAADVRADTDPLLMYEVDEDLQSVLAAVRELFSDYPDERWILNATGGNKMMSVALGLLAAQPQVHAVVYRHLRLGWRRVVPGTDVWGWQEVAIDPADSVLGGLIDPGNVLDQLPIKRLMHAQFAAQEVTAKVNTRGLPKPPPDVADWLDHVARPDAPGFATYRHWQGQPSTEGSAFECWLALLLRAGGATQVAWSCEGVDPQGNKVFESDVVAMCGDRLVFYDAKLQRPDTSGKTDQIRSARETAMRLGGLAAGAVLVRPNWPDTPHVARFADVLGVQLIHRGHIAELLSRLLAPLGLVPPDGGQGPLQRVNATLGRLHANRGRSAFAHGVGQ